MKIYRPIKTDNITQVFGQNLVCAVTDSNGKIIQPYKLISAIGDGLCPSNSVPFYPSIGMKGHNGEDWLASRGEPVYFPVVASGIEWQAASEVDQAGGIGVNVRSKTPVPLEKLPLEATGSLNLIKKQYEKLDGKVYLKFKFWHLLSHNVYDKKPIKAGDLLGYADSTGASGADHLHWSMKVSDETSWFALDGDNGYNGALDFAMWFENKFILDTINAEPPKPDNPQKASDLIAVFAAQKQAKGDLKAAKVLFALANFLRAFGN